jgi:chromosome segregation ATPase
MIPPKFLTANKIRSHLQYLPPVFQKYESKIESLENQIKENLKKFDLEKDEIADMYKKALDERDDQIITLKQKIGDMEYDTGLKIKNVDQYKELLQQEKDKVGELEMHVAALNEEIAKAREEMSGENLET